MARSIRRSGQVNSHLRNPGRFGPANKEEDYRSLRFLARENAKSSFGNALSILQACTLRELNVTLASLSSRCRAFLKERAYRLLNWVRRSEIIT